VEKAVTLKETFRNRWQTPLAKWYEWHRTESTSTSKWLEKKLA